MRYLLIACMFSATWKIQLFMFNAFCHFNHHDSCSVYNQTRVRPYSHWDSSMNALQSIAHHCLRRLQQRSEHIRQIELRLWALNWASDSNARIRPGISGRTCVQKHARNGIYYWISSRKRTQNFSVIGFTPQSGRELIFETAYCCWNWNCIIIRPKVHRYSIVRKLIVTVHCYCNNKNE